MITCDAIIDTTKTVPTNFKEKKVACKKKKIIYLVYLSLLIVFTATLQTMKQNKNTYCHILPQRTNQKSFVLIIYYKNG